MRITSVPFRLLSGRVICSVVPEPLVDGLKKLYQHFFFKTAFRRDSRRDSRCLLQTPLCRLNLRCSDGSRVSVNSRRARS